LIRIVYLIIDVSCILLAFYLACWIAKDKLPFHCSVSNICFSEINPYRLIFVAWIVLTIIQLNSYGLYHTRREVLEGVELALVAKAVFLASLIMAVGIYIMKVEDFPRSIFFISTFSIMVFLSLWRLLKRIFVEALVANGYNNLNVLIIGAGRVGQELAKEIRRRPGLGLKIVGFLDDFKANDPGNPDVKILGKISDFQQIALREFVAKVFITILHDNASFSKVLEDAKENSIIVRVVPPGFDLTTGEFHKYNIGIIPILEYYETQYTLRQLSKNVFDFFVSLLTFVVLLPFFIMLGILIKLDSPGPIIYRSRRYGRKGKIFNMYKFRSMVVDAEQSLEKLKEKNEVDGPIFKIKNDPRVTRMGRFLRKYSLDELPQIINVLKGDMSLVGPRPFPIEQIEREDLKQLKRLEVRPGITGLWQIRGRSDISFARLIKWDVWYIKNWSFWLDLNILFQTIPVVIKGKGAY